MSVTVRRADADGRDIDGMAEVLVDCVEGGASVGFMHPFDQARAQAFWETALRSADRSERIILVAEVEGVIEGTVQLVLDGPENQPHRGDISKMLVRRRARRQGLAQELMVAAEAEARQAGKTLLVLDTASPDAERLYDRLGWQQVGRIPDYALWPDGRLVDTVVFYKALTAAAPPPPRPEAPSEQLKAAARPGLPGPGGGTASAGRR